RPTGTPAEDGLTIDDKPQLAACILQANRLETDLSTIYSNNARRKVQLQYARNQTGRTMCMWPPHGRSGNRNPPRNHVISVMAANIQGKTRIIDDQLGLLNGLPQGINDE